MEETEFKFEPIWVTALTLFEAYLVYFIITSELAPETRLDLLGLAVMSILPLFLGSVILPMTFKLLTSVPALQLTNDSLVDNILGINIDWSNIENIRISGSQKPFLAIDLKDRNKFYSDISNPINRTFLRLIFLIAPGDVSINLAFVKGNNEAILAATQGYWNRHHGNYEK